MDAVDVVAAGIGVTLIGALSYTFTNLLKNFFAAMRREVGWNGVVTQLAAYAAGIGATLLVKASKAGWDSMIPGLGQNVGDLNFAGVCIVGLLGSSVFSYLHNRNKAVDTTDSARTPDLLPDTRPAPPGA